MADDPKKLIENEKFRVVAHLSSIANGFLVTFVVVPLVGWMLITTQTLTVTTAQDREANQGRLNALSERITQIIDTMRYQDVRTDKLDDRVRDLEIAKKK